MLALLLLFFGPMAGAAQTTTDGAYSDPSVRLLVERARASRQAGSAGIDSYEAKLKQRIYVGITALRFRRERGVFEHERIARIRWESSGDRAIQWEGVRTAIPIAGIDTGNPDGPAVRASVADSSVSVTASRDLEEDMAADLLDEIDMPGFDFEPGGDRLTFGSGDEDGEMWALHPLSDTADAHYRFHAGDTLTISLPSNQRQIVLHEVRVEPRRSDFRLVAGSLWFDEESASLVRATYKPARPFDLAVDEPGDEDEVPGFLQPIEADIEYMTVEYSLQEFEYWLPRRFAFQGEARLGSLARVPITLEWSLTQYLVNEAPTDVIVDAPLPDGWQREEHIETDSLGNETRVVVVVPTVEELRNSPDLSEDFGQRAPGAFTESEVESLASELEGLLPTYNRFRPRLDYGLGSGLVRFNRVEGLSVGARGAVPITTGIGLDVVGRFGTSNERLTGSGTFRMGPERSRWTLEGFHSLRSMDDRLDPFNMKSSLSHVLLGNDNGQYYEASGAELGYQRIGERVRFSLGAFGERHRPVALETSFSVRGEIGDLSVAPVLAAEAVDLRGLRGSLGWFRGIDPNGLVLTGRLDGEVASGDRDFQRASARISASHPLPLGLAVALEVGGGTSWGAVPIQRAFYLGGLETVRGYPTNEVGGPAFWTGRAEIATGFAAARLSGFTDVGWAGERGTFDWDDRLQGVGVGVSLLDGIFRFDVARAIRGRTGWRVHAYLDGLF